MELFGLLIYFVIQICSEMLGVQEFINFTLHYLADLDIPIKRCVCFCPPMDCHHLYTLKAIFSVCCEPSLCLWSSWFF